MSGLFIWNDDPPVFFSSQAFFSKFCIFLSVFFQALSKCNARVSVAMKATHDVAAKHLHQQKFQNIF
jgi:hypothetical protein